MFKHFKSLCGMLAVAAVGVSSAGAATLTPFINLGKPDVTGMVLTSQTSPSYSFTGLSLGATLPNGTNITGSGSFSLTAALDGSAGTLLVSLGGVDWFKSNELVALGSNGSGGYSFEFKQDADPSFGANAPAVGSLIGVNLSTASSSFDVGTVAPLPNTAAVSLTLIGCLGAFGLLKKTRKGPVA